VDIEDISEFIVFQLIVLTILTPILLILYTVYPNTRAINFFDYSSLFKDPLALVLLMISFHLAIFIALLIYFPSILLDFCKKIKKYQKLNDIHPLLVIVISPLAEEFFFKFLPYYLFGMLGLLVGLAIWVIMHGKLSPAEAIHVVILYYPVYAAAGPLNGLILGSIYHCAHNTFTLLIRKLAEVYEYY